VQVSQQLLARGVNERHRPQVNAGWLLIAAAVLLPAITKLRDPWADQPTFELEGDCVRTGMGGDPKHG
jgi:hypothetical protein